MDYDYKKRGYLLPGGCKDLIDVLKAKAASKPSAVHCPSPLPLVIGEMTVTGGLTVRELASLLKQKPFQIVADLIELKVMANVDQPVSFDIIAQVVRKYGYIAKKAA